MIKITGQLSGKRVIIPLAKQVIFPSDTHDTGIVDDVVTKNRIVPIGAIDPVVAVRKLGLLVVSKVEVVDHLPTGRNRYLVKSVLGITLEIIIRHHFTYHIGSRWHVLHSISAIVLGHCSWFMIVELAVVIQIDIDRHPW